MHTYIPLWTDDSRTWRFLGREPLRSLDDFARAAPHDPALGRLTYPEALHLDADGVFRCGSRMSSFDSLRSWATDLEPLEDAWWSAQQAGCSPNWLIVQPHRPWLHDGEPIDERDARIFITIRSAMAEVGMNILDLIVVTEEQRWWSLHELTTGETDWHFVDRPAPRRRRLQEPRPASIDAGALARQRRRPGDAGPRTVE